MERFDTPDVLVGVGGAGSQIVYEFMEQEWILESAVGVGQFADYEPDKLEAYTVDSAVDDSVHERVDGIQATIEGLKDRREGIDNGLIDVSIDHYQMTERFPGTWKQTNVLTAPEDVSDLLDARNMNAWWFEEDREPLQKMSEEGFSGGVYRRRAVSKALFHISEYAGEGVTPPSNVSDEVVMVAALGGGTGSGTVVDMAAEMDADHVDLFAVIPTTGEKQKEKTNAFAALSELEHIEINGESPFRTVTLVPYLGGAGHERQATDEEAAMAAVRSIVAHHQGMRGENLRDMLNTSSQNGPPEYSAFTVAVPKSIEYNIEKQDRAKAEIRETLDQKETELVAEANLCDLTSAFLDREFPDALDEVESPEMDERRQAVVGLRSRVEKLFEETLHQQEVEVAGIEQERDQLVELYERISENAVNDVSVGNSEFEEAREYADTVTRQLRNQIVPEEFGDEGTLGRKLAAVVQRELAVVRQRYELIERIYRLPALADRLGIKPDEAVTIRDVLVDVVLDPTERLLGTVQNPSFNVVLDEYENRRDRLVREHRQYEAFRTELRAQLDDRVSAVRSSIGDDVETITTIHRRFEPLVDGHGETVDRIDELVDQVQDKVNQILTMSRPGEVDPKLAFDEFEVLNEDLEAVGLEPVDKRNLTRGLQHLLDAKNASLDHKSGFIPGRPDRSQDYNNAVARLENDHEGFVVGGDTWTPEVGDEFDVEFDPNVVRRGKAILRRRRGAIRQVVETVTREMCQAKDELYEPDAGTLIEQQLQRIPETIRVTADLPAGLTADKLEAQLERRLSESREQDAQILLEQLFPTLEDAKHEPDTVTAMLEEAYLRPVETALSTIDDELETLGDNEVADSEGVIETFRRLRALTGRFEQSGGSVNLPSVTGPGDDEVYGGDFTQLYEGDDEFDIGLGMSSARRKSHPYVRDQEASMADLAGSPDDIEDSQVLENNEANIFGHLAKSAEQLFDRTYDRAPVEEFRPEGTGEESRAMYRGMRYVNIFFSRALSETENLTPEEGTLHPDVASVFRQNTKFDGNTYGEAQYEIGGPDEVSMVTFIAGLTMDNLARVSGPNGYKKTYDRMKDNHSFFATHHSVGLGGHWDRWSTLWTWTKADSETLAYGAYVYRDGVRDMNRTFVTELQQQTDDEVVEMLNGMFDTETFPSTISSDD
jgi:hypothetical protein